MLEYNEVKPRKYIIFEGDPYEVLTSHVFRKQMRKPVNATKLKNLITGKVVEHSFHAADKVDEAELDKKKIKYLYTHRDEHFFCDENDASKRFSLGDDVVGSSLKFVKQNFVVELLSFEGRNIGINLPIKVTLKVKEAPPAIKGDTVTGGMKLVTLENGTQINTPMFINDSDLIVINTETGEYVERASK